MNEINNFGVNNNSPAFGSSNAAGAGSAKMNHHEEMRDYKEAVDAAGAAAAGRAHVSVDNINSDMALILNNPAILDRSEALFKAAEMAGVSYPEAATFATQEVR